MAKRESSEISMGGGLAEVERHESVAEEPTLPRGDPPAAKAPPGTKPSLKSPPLVPLTPAADLPG